MRRIIENYFKLLGKYGDDDLIQKFFCPKINFSQGIGRGNFGSVFYLYC